MLKRIRILRIVFFCLLCNFSSARAQDWQLLNAPLSQVPAPYFLNPEIGFVFPEGFVFSGALYPTNAPPSLARTIDGGQTWKTLSFGSNLICSITQLSFVSISHGYLAATSQSGVAGDGGIYETRDTGTSWKRVTADSLSFGSVYAFDSLVCASEVNPNAQFGQPNNQRLFISRNSGKDWSTLTAVPGMLQGEVPQYQYVTGNKEGQISAIYFDAQLSSHLIFSTDAGISWNSRKLLTSTQPWPMVAVFSAAHRTDLIAQYVSDNDQTSDTYTLLHSALNFSTANVSLASKEIGAWVSGNACVQYVSSANLQSPGRGVLRSTNLGRNWQFIPGPDFEELDDEDYQNLSVVGHGAVVYATDLNGRLWKTTTGGDGTLSHEMFQSRFVVDHLFSDNTIDTLRVTQCDTASMQVMVQNMSCNYLKFLGVKIDGLDPGEYTQRTVHHWNTDGLPDTAFAIVKPSRSGIRNLVVHANFIDDEYETTDTTFPIILSVKPYSGPVIAVHEKPSTISGVAGDTIAIPVYLSSSQSNQIGPTSIILEYRFNEDLLKPINFVSAISSLSASSLTMGPDHVTATLTASAGINLNGELLIGWLRCRIILVDSASTSVSLASVTIASTGGRCIAQSSPTDIVHVIRTNLCGDTTLLQYMRGVPIGRILTVVPTPVATTLHIEFENSTHDLIALQLFDAMGRERKRSATTEQQTSLDVSNLTSGVYYLRSISSHGLPDTRRIIVER